MIYNYDMAHSHYMEIDLDKIIEDATPTNDRRSQPFHLSAEKVKKFKAACEKINKSNSLILEAFMVRFTDYINKKKEKK